MQLLDAGLLLEAMDVEAVLGQKDFDLDEEGGETKKKEKLDERSLIAKLRKAHIVILDLIVE